MQNKFKSDFLLFLLCVSIVKGRQLILIQFPFFHCFSFAFAHLSHCSCVMFHCHFVLTLKKYLKSNIFVYYKIQLEYQNPIIVWKLNSMIINCKLREKSDSELPRLIKYQWKCKKMPCKQNKHYSQQFIYLYIFSD